MKEYPEANYFLDVSLVGESIDPALLEFLPGTYLLDVNRVVDVIVIPWLPRAPWPPPFPASFDAWANREEAARFVFATNQISIAPTDGGATRQEVIFNEHPEMAHTVFWLPRAAFEALLADVVRLYPSHYRNPSRLGDLQAGPLLGFLQQELPKASLHPYARRILCLEPEPSGEE